MFFKLFEIASATTIKKKKTEERYLSSSSDQLWTHLQTSDFSSSEWAEIFHKALVILNQDHPKCGQLFKALLRQADIDELQRIIGVSRENVYRTLYRCRAKMKEIITIHLKVSLP